MKFRKIIVPICLLLCLSILGSALTIQVSASQYTFSQDEEIVITGNEEAEELRAKQDELERRRRAALYETVPESNLIEGWPEGPGNHGEAAIIMELHSGAVLYEKNIDASYFPASITKIMTLLIALEEGNLEDSVTVTKECVDFLEPGDAAIGLQPGQILPLEDALHAVMLASANEGAYTVMANLGEGYDWSINRMNERAIELGATNTHFTNPHGLHDEEHYVSARGMALICQELYKYPKAFEIMQTMYYTIPESETVTAFSFQQNHKMLNEDTEYFYPYTIGGKTGFTDQARNTLVTFAEKDGMVVVCVVLRGISGVIYNDTTDLFEYSFNNFEQVPINSLPKHEDIVAFDEEGYVTLPKGVDPSAVACEVLTSPDNQGQGEAIYSYHGQLVGKVNVQVEQPTPEVDAERKEKEDKNQNSASSLKTRKSTSSIIWYIIGGIVVFLLVAGITLFMIANARRKKARRKARREMLQKRRAREARRKQDSRGKLDE